jgi:peptidoglycan hydrolase-like protein with peptidoglycan-binding domain
MPPAPGRPVLTGDDVAYVQRYIGAAKAGPADGVFGARTRTAVRWYQQIRRLSADGIVGKSTWTAMGVRNSL